MIYKVQQWGVCETAVEAGYQQWIKVYAGDKPCGVWSFGKPIPDHLIDSRKISEHQVRADTAILAASRFIEWLHNGQPAKWLWQKEPEVTEYKIGSITHRSIG